MEAWTLPGQVDRLSEAATCQPFSRQQSPSYKSPGKQNALKSVAMDPVFLGNCWVTSSKQAYLSKSVQLSERDPVLGCVARKIQ